MAFHQSRKSPKVEVILQVVASTGKTAESYKNMPHIPRKNKAGLSDSLLAAGFVDIPACPAKREISKTMFPAQKEPLRQRSSVSTAAL